MTAVEQNSLPRGLRNNNPGNIKANKTEWQGLATPRDDRHVFDGKGGCSSASRRPLPASAPWR